MPQASRARVQERAIHVMGSVRHFACVRCEIQSRIERESLMTDRSPPGKSSGGPLVPFPRDPKRVLELVASMLVAALVASQFDVTAPTLAAILAVGLILLVVASWPTE